MILKKAKYLFVVLFITINISVFSQESTSFWQTLKDDGDCVVNDLKYFGNSFGEISICNLLGAGAFLGADFLIAQYDEEIREMIKLDNDSTFYNYFSVVNEFGSLYSQLGIPVVTYLTGLAFGSEEIRATGRQMTESVLVAGLLTVLIKEATGRARPYNELGNSRFRPFSFKESYRSFPSGHSTGVFAIATVLSLKIDRWWAYVSLYTLAVSTSLSRIYFDRHWASDVVMGAAIGTLTSIIIVRAGNQTKDNVESRLSISASFPVINISYSF
jgi:membrane-associated phospholipid phosphatase